MENTTYEHILCSHDSTAGSCLIVLGSRCPGDDCGGPGGGFGGGFRA